MNGPSKLRTVSRNRMACCFRVTARVPLAITRNALNGRKESDKFRDAVVRPLHCSLFTTMKTGWSIACFGHSHYGRRSRSNGCQKNNRRCEPTSCSCCRNIFGGSAGSC